MSGIEWVILGVIVLGAGYFFWKKRKERRANGKGPGPDGGPNKPIVDTIEK